MNGRGAQESGLRLKAALAPGPTIHCDSRFEGPSERVVELYRAMVVAKAGLLVPLHPSNRDSN